MYSKRQMKVSLAAKLGFLSAMLLSPLLNACGNNSDANMSRANQPTVMPGPINYLALGDSTGAGVGARDGGYVLRLFKRLEQERPGSTLTNLCVSGATTADLLRDQLDRGISSKPQLITIGIGTNDVGHNVSVQRFAENYKTMLERLKSETQAVIVISNIPDVSSSPRIPASSRYEYQQMVKEFNRRIDQLADAYGIAVFDVYTITHEELPKHPEYFSADQFHPSDAGYQLWADEMWPILAKLVNR
jgi:acyl-CoA thioesterase-1